MISSKPIGLYGEDKAWTEAVYQTHLFHFHQNHIPVFERSAISDGDNAWLEAVAGTRLDTVAWYVVRGTRYVVRGMWNVVRGTRLERVAAI